MRADGPAPLHLLRRTDNNHRYGRAALLVRLSALCDEFECYGYCRNGAALRQQGIVVNGKKLRRLMRENGLQPRLRRRFKATTDSDHDLSVFPNLAADLVPDGPDQLRVADL